MKTLKSKKVAIMTMLLIMILSTVVHAKSYKVAESEKNNTIENIKSNVIVTEDGHYEVSNIDVTDLESNYMEISDTRTMKNLKTNDKEKVKSMFNKTIDYIDEEKGYKGTLSLDSVEITGKGETKYEEIEKYDIKFEKFSSNDLNSIEKTITVNGKTYYLIHVDWKADKTEIIDGHEVIISYKGIKHYETVVSRTNPASYTATATYKGKVEKIEKEYILDVQYNFIKKEEPEPIPEKDNTAAIIMTTVISGLGISVILLLIFSNNVKVYNAVSNKEKLVLMTRISKDKLMLNLSKVRIRNSNIYIIKLKKSLFNNIRGKELKIYLPNGTVQSCTIISEKFTINL